jgi:hypothetical protein
MFSPRERGAPLLAVVTDFPGLSPAFAPVYDIATDNFAVGPEMFRKHWDIVMSTRARCIDVTGLQLLTKQGDWLCLSSGYYLLSTHRVYLTNNVMAHPDDGRECHQRESAPSLKGIRSI